MIAKSITAVTKTEAVWLAKRRCAEASQATANMGKKMKKRAKGGGKNERDFTIHAALNKYSLFNL